MSTTHADEYDAPWKEALEVSFDAFLAFFLPHAYAEIDWSQPITFQDKELQKLIREAEQGTHTVDKLVEVKRKNSDDMSHPEFCDSGSLARTPSPLTVYTYFYKNINVARAMTHTVRPLQK